MILRRVVTAPALIVMAASGHDSRRGRDRSPIRDIDRAAAEMSILPGVPPLPAMIQVGHTTGPSLVVGAIHDEAPFSPRSIVIVRLRRAAQPAAPNHGAVGENDRVRCDLDLAASPRSACVPRCRLRPR